MRFLPLRSYLLVVALALALAACSGGDTVAPDPNTAPEIEFTFAPLAVPAGEPGVQLTVDVSDEDADDNLTVTWEITRGSLTPSGDGRSASWDVPLTRGTDTVTIRVSDGTDSETITADIKVGTLSLATQSSTQYLKSESPYILRPGNSPPKLVVPGGLNTNVQAGVEIYLDIEDMAIDVAGNLALSGTPDEPVIIRPNDRTLFCGSRRGWWAGILVSSDAQSDGFVSIQDAEVWYGDTGVRLRDGGSATIRDSAIRCSNTAGVLHDGSGSLVIEDTEIANGALNGIAIGRETQSTFPVSVAIRRCEISINGGAGIALDLFDEFQQVPIVIEDNKLEFNLTHGITMRRAVFPTVQYNHFSSNGVGGTSNVRLLGDYPSGVDFPELDMTCNYWGFAVANQSTIEATIFDRADDLDIGTRIIVLPWLLEDPFGAGTRPPCTGGE